MQLPPPSPLTLAMQQESEKFQEYYLWLEKAMPPAFFEDVSRESLFLITHSLIGFDLQDFFSTIHLKNAAIVLCLDSPDADLRILEKYALYGIKNYEAYVSKTSAPFPGITAPLRIATLGFTEVIESSERPYTIELKEQLRLAVQKEDPSLSDEAFNRLVNKLSPRFLYSLSTPYLSTAIQMLAKAETHDNCQYQVYYENEWSEKELSSMHVVLAWRNTPKHHFLYKLARVIHRHGLSMKSVNATYTAPYSQESVLVMVLDLHGSDGQAVWDAADIPDFLRELATVKYFEDGDAIDRLLVSKKIISGNMGNFLRTLVTFIHQTLVHIDVNLYTVDNIEESLCRHPELTQQLCKLFELKFDPDNHDLNRFKELCEHFQSAVNKLDTGQEENDTRRKHVLHQGMNFISYCLKTNFYRLNYTALSFRLDPHYLDAIPFDRSKKFPDLPFAIFFIQGMHFFAFHIRFKDLARGGLRTVYIEQYEQMIAERNNVFTECYYLALTQHKKNKDIPEGGAKGVIFLKPFDRIDAETHILRTELEWSKHRPENIEEQIENFRSQQKIESLYQSQRSFIENLLVLVNCDSDGKIRARHILDYFKQPEYLYLGPDENMHSSMIEWIATFSKKHHYKSGSAFITSKVYTGINHKEYGVTSLGINVYMHRTLEFLGINPLKDLFTIKMSGGPDGDVAGNQLLNLYHLYPTTAKLIALTDGTGTIHDDQGLNLEIIKELFYQNKGIRSYPPEKLSAGGFLVDKWERRYLSGYMQETLCWRKVGTKLIKEWLSGSDTNYFLRHNLHQAKTDIFIPAGGRPRTLNETNIQEFLDDTGRPTSRAIIEGANLYLNSKARQFLEEKGVVIIKDSSANKGGVICSSFEVLCGLALKDHVFLQQKDILVKEILERIKECALQEADLLFKTHEQTNQPLTLISDKISEQINLYKYQILDYLNALPLASQSTDPMIRCFLNYCLPTLKNDFTPELLKEIPVHHKKAIIACQIAAYMVYTKGLNWSPSIVDILPLILAGTSLTI